MTKVQPPIETNKINRYVIEDCGVINYWQSFVRVGLKVFFFLKKSPDNHRLSRDFLGDPPGILLLELPR